MLASHEHQEVSSPSIGRVICRVRAKFIQLQLKALAGRALSDAGFDRILIDLEGALEFAFDLEQSSIIGG